MEGGNPLLEYLTYGMIGIVLLAIITLSLRTMKLMLSLFFAAPVTRVLGRIGPIGRMLDRWARRGREREPDIWRNHDAGPTNPAA